MDSSKQNNNLSHSINMSAVEKRKATILKKREDKIQRKETNKLKKIQKEESSLLNIGMNEGKRKYVRKTFKPTLNKAKDNYEQLLEGWKAELDERFKAADDIRIHREERGKDTKTFFVTTTVIRDVSYKQRNGKWTERAPEKVPLKITNVVKAKTERQAIHIVDTLLASSEGGGYKVDQEDSYIEAFYSHSYSKATESMTGLSTGRMKMKACNYVKYNSINNSDVFDKKTGHCVMDNFLACYPHVKKEDFLKIVNEFYTCESSPLDEGLDLDDDGEGWNVNDGISPDCLQVICQKYDISHYAFDIAENCFLKSRSKNRNYPALVYYAIDNHQYLIKDKKDIKSMCERSKVKTDFNTNIIQQLEFDNKFDRDDLLENVPVEELVNYNDLDSYVIIYSRDGVNDLNDIVRDVIKYYGVPKVRVSHTSINQIKVIINKVKYWLCLDPNDRNKGMTWRRVFDLCIKHNIEFKNQTFVGFIRQLREQHFEDKNARVNLSIGEREKLIKKFKNKCNVCKETVKRFHIDHIKPLANGGTNVMKNLQVLCPSCHKDKCHQEQEDGDYVKTSETESSYNSQVAEIMRSPAAFSYAFIEKLNKEDTGDKIYRIDINKSRTEQLYSSKYDYPLFTVFDRVVKYNGQTGAGIYFIKHGSYFPLRGNGWYYYPMVDYCLKSGIIKAKDILYTVQASLTVKHDYYSSFIDKCRDELPVELSKLAINSMIGAFHPNIDKQTTTESICITREPMEAFFQYNKNDGSFVEKIEVDDNIFYHVTKERHIQKVETEAPIYQQIIQLENIELHKLSLLIESKGGKVYDLSTDCVICTFPDDKLPFEVDDDGLNIKGHEWRAGVYKYKLEFKEERLKFEKKARWIRRDFYKIINREWTIYNDVEDNDFTPLVNKVIDSDSSFYIDGPAGCGKTTLINMIKSKLDVLLKKYAVLAPTNKAALLINGTTLHRYSTKINSMKAIKDMKVDYIFVDEISMMKEIFYKLLLTIKMINPKVKFILVGDFNQLPPVNDRISEYTDYKNSIALLELADAKKIVLSKCRRSDDKLFNMCKFETIMSRDKTNFNNELTFKHLCYTNKMRIYYNEMMNNKMEVLYHKKKICLKKSEFDPNSQDVILYPKMPIIAHINNKELDIINNEEYTVEKIKGNMIFIKNDRCKKVIDVNDFQKLFYLAYAMTIHKSQGCTFDFPYTIHEWDRLTDKLRYVALTRATKLEYINVIN